jgi:di/tricarboxylate transporter
MRTSGSSETRLLVLMMLAIAGLGAFMSSTGVVAIFIPVALSIARKIGVSPGRLMMPLAYAALISGMLTLIAALLAALAMGLFRCVDMESAYRSVNWQSLVLIAGMLPFATALDKTGGIELIVDGLIGTLGDGGPYAVMAGLFVLTALIGAFVSNTATAVLMAPIAISAAESIGVAPYPFAMTVAIAASAAFLTPVSSPVNTLVLAPGDYRFIDFLRVGTPIVLLVMVVTMAVIPILFPLQGDGM